ncbi:esterase-like activity of phytase family protein [Streptomyces sp. NPDC086519]|uniref:esterase-like activity of phytase family protein n=1 Tax=Streptomyces sp. NPDC086519 TaxID=3154863 RepID=UPI00341CABE9
MKQPRSQRNHSAAAPDVQDDSLLQEPHPHPPEGDEQAVDANTAHCHAALREAVERRRGPRNRRSAAKGRKAMAEYAYRFDPVSVVDPSEDDTSELKISSIVAVGGDRLLVEERTDNAARLQVVKLDHRSDILGGACDDDTTSPSLEQLEDPAAAGVPVLGKRLVVDLNTVTGVPLKIEGIARVDHDTLALSNDNDFGMTDGAGTFDAQGRLVDSGVETTLVYVRLSKGL